MKTQTSMKPILLYGTESCHKTQLYKNWLGENNVPFLFKDISDEEVGNKLSELYDGKAKHFPTLVVGNKRLRNPSTTEISKWLLNESIRQLPDSYSELSYMTKKYSVLKNYFNKGQSTKVFAKELGGNDIISFNFYRTKSGNYLKPCEMPKRKVLDFLLNYKQLKK
ncbi:MAG: hypothetical protein ABGX00_15210 [Allomuricauda sp.]